MVFTPSRFFPHPASNGEGRAESARPWSRQENEPAPGVSAAAKPAGTRAPMADDKPKRDIDPNTNVEKDPRSLGATG